MVSEALTRFKYCFFEDPYSARDYLDTESAEVLEGEDRVCAETMLLDFLPDLRAVIGLGVLRSRKALPALRARFESAPTGPFSYGQVETALAIYRIEPDSRMAAYLGEALVRASDWSARMQAALALANLPVGEAAPALLQGLEDADKLIRHHAAAALLRLHGIGWNADDLEHPTVRIMSGSVAIQERARGEIRAAIKRLDGLP